MASSQAAHCAAAARKGSCLLFSIVLHSMHVLHVYNVVLLVFIPAGGAGAGSAPHPWPAGLHWGYWGPLLCRAGVQPQLQLLHAWPQLPRLLLSDVKRPRRRSLMLWNISPVLFPVFDHLVIQLFLITS